MDKYRNDWYSRYQSASETIKKKEFEKLTIELAWKSSQIEGNTYTLLDTERLIKERQEAEGHPRIDEVEYKKAIILLHETGNIYYLKKLFIEQFRQACSSFS